MYMTRPKGGLTGTGHETAAEKNASKKFRLTTMTKIRCEGLMRRGRMTGLETAVKRERSIKNCLKGLVK